MPEPIVYSTPDKEKRDELWRELRIRGRKEERLAVRFSDAVQFGIARYESHRRHWVAQGTETRVARRLVRLDDGKWRLVPFERTKPRKVYALVTENKPIERPAYRTEYFVSHPAESQGVES